MNAALAKMTTHAPAACDRVEPDSPANDPIEPLGLADETLFDENTNRRLYRRSVAYFFFGFGYNKHEIVTDEP